MHTIGSHEVGTIQPYSIQPHPTYLSTSKICRVELCTELFYAIIPTLFLCFLLICYPYIFNAFYSGSCSRCMLELKFACYKGVLWTKSGAETVPWLESSQHAQSTTKGPLLPQIHSLVCLYNRLNMPELTLVSRSP